MPWSDTPTAPRRPGAATVTSTRLPVGEYFSALLTRLCSTCSRRVGSQRSSTGSSGSTSRSSAGAAGLVQLHHRGGQLPRVALLQAQLKRPASMRVASSRSPTMRSSRATWRRTRPIVFCRRSAGTGRPEVTSGGGHLQRGERVAQVVRHAGQEGELLLLLTRQGVGHLVEGARHVAQLGGARLGGAGALAAGAEAAHGPADVEQRAEDGAAQPRKTATPPSSRARPRPRRPGGDRSQRSAWACARGPPRR